MPADLRLRDHAPADRDGLLEVFDSNVGEFLHAEERPGFVEWLERPEGTFLTLLQGERPIGCGGYVLEQGDLRLTWGLLHREHHGRGLGRWLLLERLCRGHAEHHPPRCTLATTPRVEPFFAGVGFERTGFRPDGWGPGLDRVEMVLDYGGTTLEALSERRARAALSAGGA